MRQNFTVILFLIIACLNAGKGYASNVITMDNYGGPLTIQKELFKPLKKEPKFCQPLKETDEKYGTVDVKCIGYVRLNAKSNDWFFLSCMSGGSADIWCNLTKSDPAKQGADADKEGLTLPGGMIDLNGDGTMTIQSRNNQFYLKKFKFVLNMKGEVKEIIQNFYDVNLTEPLLQDLTIYARYSFNPSTEQIDLSEPLAVLHKGEMITVLQQFIPNELIREKNLYHDPVFIVTDNQGIAGLAKPQAGQCNVSESQTFKNLCFDGD